MLKMKFWINYAIFAQKRQISPKLAKNPYLILVQIPYIKIGSDNLFPFYAKMGPKTISLKDQKSFGMGGFSFLSKTSRTFRENSMMRVN